MVLGDTGSGSPLEGHIGGAQFCADSRRGRCEYGRGRVDCDALCNLWRGGIGCVASLVRGNDYCSRAGDGEDVVIGSAQAAGTGNDAEYDGVGGRAAGCGKRDG